MPLTFSWLPVGGAVSLLKLSDKVAVFPAASAPVSVYAAGVLGLAVQLNGVET